MDREVNLESLYELWTTATTKWLKYRFRSDWEDESHNGFILFVEAVRGREVTAPAYYARGIVSHLVLMRRRVVAPGSISDHEYSKFMVSQQPNPEEQAIKSQRVRLALKTVERLPAGQCRVLRLILSGENRGEVISAMGITDDQYRNWKTRGIAECRRRVERYG